MTVYAPTRSFALQRPFNGRKGQQARSSGVIEGSALGLTVGTAAILTLKISMLWAALQAI